MNRREENQAFSLFESAQLGPIRLKNRIVRSATNEHLSTSSGQLTPEWAQIQIELAKYEVGLIITGHMTVDRGQRADEGQVVLDRQIDLELLRKTAEQVHSYGGKFLAQISHSGRKGAEAVNRRPPRSPEDFTQRELSHLVEQFVDGARICKEAGLDGIQIHNAHGYLLSSFLNPQENHRTDEFGGSLENRFRLPEKILKGVRAACGSDFAILVKADVNGCGDFHRLLELYQAAGADGVEISGTDFNLRAGQKKAFYLKEACQAKEGIHMPLILVGGIFSRSEAEEIQRAGIPFVAFSRSLICQPDFIARMKTGEQNESRCTACNQCYSVYRRRPVRCEQHKIPIPQLETLFGPY